jgi:hypothetical protein
VLGGISRGERGGCDNGGADKLGEPIHQGEPELRLRGVCCQLEACEAVGCALDDIVAQEEILGREPIGRARCKVLCHVRSPQLAILARVNP